MKSKGPDVHTSCPGSASGFEGSEIRLEFYRVASSHFFRGRCFDRLGGIRQILSFPQDGDEIRAPAERRGLGSVGPDSVVRRKCKRIRSVLAKVADFSGGRADVKGVFAG